MGRLLVIEGEELLAHKLSQHFQEAGYEVDLATTCEDGLTLATTGRPDLILLALELPDREGMEAFRLLHDKPRTHHIPVMVLAERDKAALRNDVLEAGARDFIEKPLDLDILTLQVRNALRQTEREGLTEPRTGLPSGRLLAERLHRLPDEQGWYRIDLDIVEFGVFRDLYGFVTANEALRFAGNLISQLVNEYGSPDDFVGHFTGTETFVIVTAQVRGPMLRDQLSQRVTEELKSFYNFMERDQGYVLVEDGSGGQVEKPLMSARLTVDRAAGQPEDEWVDAVEEDEDQLPPEDEALSGSSFEW